MVWLLQSHDVFLIPLRCEVNLMYQVNPLKGKKEWLMMKIGIGLQKAGLRACKLE